MATNEKVVVAPAYPWLQYLATFQQYGMCISPFFDRKSCTGSQHLSMYETPMRHYTSGWGTLEPTGVEKYGLNLYMQRTRSTIRLEINITDDARTCGTVSVDRRRMCESKFLERMSALPFVGGCFSKSKGVLRYTAGGLSVPFTRELNITFGNSVETTVIGDVATASPLLNQRGVTAAIKAYVQQAFNEFTWRPLDKSAVLDYYLSAVAWWRDASAQSVWNELSEHKYAHFWWISPKGYAGQDEMLLTFLMQHMPSTPAERRAYLQHNKPAYVAAATRRIKARLPLSQFEMV